MTPKILPGATEILLSVREAIRDLIAPALAGDAERSAAATAIHMLRYVEHMIDRSGQMLLDEEARLKAILPAAADWLADRPGAAPLAEAIRASVARGHDPAVYPTLAMMQDEVAVLRQHVCDTLLALQSAGDAEGADGGDGAALHGRLRDYIGWQLLEEGKMVEPAFLGHGPRR